MMLIFSFSPDQVQREIGDCLDFAIDVFETYGFEQVNV